MKRNIFRLLLSAVLMMCCTVSAMAQLGTPPNDEIWYTSSDGSVIEPYDKNVFGATYQSSTYGTNGHGTIKFNGNVTSIGKFAFYHCYNLASITIPNSVTYIGESAFELCSGLNSVTIPNGVTSIGWGAFLNCTSLTQVAVPNSVSSIERLAFFECTSLTTVTIPNSITNIGAYAFEFCENLHDVFFWGKNNITLGEDVFYGTFATIYVGDKTKFPETWGGRPVRSWRSGKGDGTRESPYEIENYMNLYGFSLEVLQGNTSICGKLTADITANNNVLKADGTLNAGVFKPWEPIGGQGYGFRGEFDGGGHIISGLYFNDANRQAVGLFGKAAGSEESNSPDRSYIHDVGVRDSYFNGISHVGGICGDFALGRMENCWNAATVQSVNSVAGGIAGSCWRYAFMSGCYNIGKVSEGTESGGVCGIVSKNNEVDYSVSNCVSLEGKCSVAYNLYPTTSQTYADDGGAKVNNVYILNDSKFASGDVCWILNGNNIGTKWRQQIGKNSYPVWTGNYLVNHSDGKGFYNETMCEKENGIHSLEKKVVTKCDNSTVVYWHCSACGKDFTDADRAKEESIYNTSCHFPEYVKAILPTESAEGRYGYYQCTKCSDKFKDEPCHQPWANDNDLIVPKAKSNEIWYTSTKNQRINPNKADGFGATITDNKYEYGIGVITFDKDVTSIGEEAFFAGGWNGFARTECIDLQSISIPSAVTSIGERAFLWCTSLQSINIPSGVTGIGSSAFGGCSSIASVIFKSLPKLSNGLVPFMGCDNLASKILDLTDSDKPYIGNSLANYPEGGFTEARYRRTLEKDKWGTIVLPFKPSAESTEGLKFYALQSMAIGGEEGGTLTFMKVDAPEAGVPYLFRNEGESADFTLTAETPSSIELKTKEVGTTDFKMKGCFQQNQLDGAQNGNLYYLKDNGFYHANGNINIDPFRAYIEGSGAAHAKSFMLVISDNGEDITAIPGIMDKDGNIDETEAIYDLSGRKLSAPVKGQINIIRLKSGKTVKRRF